MNKSPDVLPTTSAYRTPQTTPLSAAPLLKLQGCYPAVQRNGGYFLEIREAYAPAGVTTEDWAADLVTLRRLLDQLDPRVEVKTQVGALVWRFSASNGSLNTSASFQGRARSAAR
ncbi:hypothetical protein DKM44_13840 [Deinococcus irradiatisoli]|uniref:Uncharacterized protein n=1 Tax=Deinococcus irradiatisoli TaxID=2202254 RepID=A0A2Z3JJQ8_9DEIO|nr:hypothetical protein [Deinococcus irradiatisoli]AWN24176.1 hypothetical protein DKM44_13840 [Deinococcus irradiatisoli]